MRQKLLNLVFVGLGIWGGLIGPFGCSSVRATENLENLDEKIEIKTNETVQTVNEEVLPVEDPQFSPKQRKRTNKVIIPPKEIQEASAFIKNFIIIKLFQTPEDAKKLNGLMNRGQKDEVIRVIKNSIMLIQTTGEAYNYTKNLSDMGLNDLAIRTAKKAYKILNKAESYSVKDVGYTVDALLLVKFEQNAKETADKSIKLANLSEELVDVIKILKRVGKEKEAIEVVNNFDKLETVLGDAIHVMTALSLIGQEGRATEIGKKFSKVNALDCWQAYYVTKILKFLGNTIEAKILAIKSVTLIKRSDDVLPATNALLLLDQNDQEIREATIQAATKKLTFKNTLDIQNVTEAHMLAGLTKEAEAIAKTSSRYKSKPSKTKDESTTFVSTTLDTIRVIKTLLLVKLDDAAKLEAKEYVKIFIGAKEMFTKKGKTDSYKSQVKAATEMLMRMGLKESAGAMAKILVELMGTIKEGLEMTKTFLNGGLENEAKEAAQKSATLIKNGDDVKRATKALMLVGLNEEAIKAASTPLKYKKAVDARGCVKALMVVREGEKAIQETEECINKFTDNTNDAKEAIKVMLKLDFKEQAKRIVDKYVCFIKQAYNAGEAREAIRLLMLLELNDNAKTLMKEWNLEDPQDPR